jgi:hypothetical protein
VNVTVRSNAVGTKAPVPPDDVARRERPVSDRRDVIRLAARTIVTTSAFFVVDRSAEAVPAQTPAITTSVANNAELPEGASPEEAFRTLGAEVDMDVAGPPLAESHPLP